MSKKKLLIISFLISLFVNSQNTKKIQILDSITLEPIPYSTIYFSNNSNKIIADNEGNFELFNMQYNSGDTIFISTMGYKESSLRLDLLVNETIEDVIKIYLNEKPIDLENVIITNNTYYSSKEIIEKVEKNIKKNYSFELRSKKIFYKEDVRSIIEEIDITNFKSSINDINESIIDSLTSNYTRTRNELEILCNFYGNFEEEKQKIKILKARETSTEKNDVITSLNNRLEKIIKENVKSNSYFKVKSGIFSRKFNLTNQEIDSIKKDSSTFNKQNLDQKKSQQRFANSKKNSINDIYSKLFFNSNPELTFINKKNRYNFSDPELIFMDGELVYVISFSPKRLEFYEGVIYVNSDDFAIIRIDFLNTKSVFKFKLLGVYADRYLRSGKMIFSKNNDEKYELSYFFITNSMRNGAKRSLKIIEKNKYVKGRRKQNQLSFNLNLKVGVSFDREIRLINSKGIDEVEFLNFVENNNITPEYLDSFTNNLWE